MAYRCIATSEIGFVQQLACNYLPHGYWFYVKGKIPEGKNAKLVDEKIVEKYEIDVSRQTRARRKSKGLSNLQYLRLGQDFVLVATKGRHLFFEEEGGSIRDVREQPIRFHGYSISVKRGDYLRKEGGDGPAKRDGRFRSRVRVSRPVYLDWHAYFAEAAKHVQAERLARELYQFPYEPYAPVRKQVLRLVSVVNRVRKERGRRPLDPKRVVRYRRRIVRPFDLPNEERGGS